jgi:hypothetical protein
MVPLLDGALVDADLIYPQGCFVVKVGPLSQSVQEAP